MSSGDPSPPAIQPGGSPSRADENGADAEQPTNGASASATGGRSDGEREGKEEESSVRRSSRRATVDVSRRVQTPTLSRRTNNKPTSTASQKKNTPANPPARAASPPVEPAPSEARVSSGSTVNDDDEVENELAPEPHASPLHQQPSPPREEASPEKPAVATVAMSVGSVPGLAGVSSAVSSAIARTTRTPSASLQTDQRASTSASPNDAPSATNGNDSASRSTSQGSPRKVSGTPKPLKTSQEHGHEVIELGDSDDDMDEPGPDDPPAPVSVKAEEDATPLGDDGGEDLDDEDEDEEDDEEEDEEEDEEGSDEDDGEGGANGDQSEGVEGDDEDDDDDGDDDEGAMDGVEEGGQPSASSQHAPTGAPSLPNPSSLSSSQLPTDLSATVNVLQPRPAGSLLPINAEAGPSALPVNEPLVPIKKTRKRREASPSPPPALKKPDITLRLEVAMSKGKGSYTEFSLYEKAHEAGLYDDEVMSIWSIKGQKQEEANAIKAAEEEKLRAETEEEAMARMLEEKYGKEDAMSRPKKRRRRRKDDNEYDVGDPFIDDSTAAVDAPEFQGVPVQEGFFVHVGAVRLKEVDAPAPKPRGRGRPRASDGGPATKRFKLDGTPLSPASGTDYGAAIGRDGLSPTAELSRRLQQSPEPEPPKPDISPEVEEGFVTLKVEVSKCDWTNKAKFPPHMRPILAALAQKAIQTDCYKQPFFDRMPDIFPYNKFTITKLIKKEVFNYYHEFLKQKRADLVTAFKKEVKVVADERLEQHKEAVQQWEEEQKAKADAETDGIKDDTPPPAAPPPFVAPPHVPLENRSATPEPIPATHPTNGNANGDDGDHTPGPGKDGDKPPIKKFGFSPEMKQILWQLHLVLVETMDATNDVNKYSNTPEIPLTSLNKGLYADLVTCFPPGYMTTTNISRQLSAMKDADKKKQDRHAIKEAAIAKEKAEWEEQRAKRAAYAAANPPPAVTGWMGGGGGGGGVRKDPPAGFTAQGGMLGGGMMGQQGMGQGSGMVGQQAMMGQQQQQVMGLFGGGNGVFGGGQGGAGGA